MVDAKVVSFDSRGLTLEGVLTVPPAQGAAPGVVVCHPHPLHGGTMQSSVVAGLEEAMVAAGVAVLRFNFRGVGRSQGAFDNGVGEADDAVAALLFLARQDGVDMGRMGLAGYSFGAGVAAAVAEREEQVRALALVSCPRRWLEAPALQGLAKPKLLIGGDRDHLVDGAAFESITRGLSDPTETHLVEGADHFWRGMERTVGGMAADFFARRLASPS